MKPLLADIRQVDFVQDRAEQLIFARQDGRNFLQDRYHCFPSRPFNHDNCVVFIAKFVDVVDP